MTKTTRFLFGIDEALTITTRTINGDSWYMAAIICSLLGREGQHSQLVQKYLEEHEWDHKTIHIGGYGKKRVLLVNTSGMLKLIMRGRTQYALDVQARIAQAPAIGVLV